ncbi:hypothetical protein IW146_001632 [Coemansia sp. RSA 922]|nr:hypothetical protein H4S03_000923 [Coemansia sp. S3946]KAJ2052400.1 hypothetical protein H4S04_001360 [Coemansia sp. S16]KAJ2099341.1 hypothetical protein GGI09_002840 [Coemansia sp. S100]KAJ2116312.1 hypothetical protein IW146_001632 [Coemansia sp. RSA 922]
MSADKEPGSTSAATDEKHLSTKLQSMKFMQRSAARAKVDEEKKLEKRLISESQWRAVYADGVISKERPKSRVVYEPSYLQMPKDEGGSSAYIGRRSFKAFNKQTDQVNAEVESQLRDQQAEQEEEKMATDDIAMAKSLAGIKRDPEVVSLRERNGRSKRSRV